MALVEAPFRAGLAELADLQGNNWNDLEAALRGASSGEKNFAANVAKACPVPGTNVAGIVSALLSLSEYQVRDSDLSKFVGEVIAEMESGEADARTIAPDKTDILKQRLTEALKIEPLRVRSKARNLIFESPSVFQTSRVVTDVRPVFGLGEELGVSGAIIKHELKIDFYDQESVKHFYVTMDDGDIKRLKLTLERAEKKARLLRSLLQKSDISDLYPREPD